VCAEGSPLAAAGLNEQRRRRVIVGISSRLLLVC
jgi:hypothetical protein